MGRYGLTPQQVVEVDILNLVHDRVTGDQLRYLRNGAHPHGQPNQRINDSATALLRG